MDLNIFKEYDIRGIYPSQIDEYIAFKLGQTLVSVFNVSKIAIGRDMRLSSQSLFDNLSEGIISGGVEVVDIGLISTDMMWFASGKYEFPLSIMVTASHNPPEWNGFKMCFKGAQAISLQTGLDKVRDRLYAWIDNFSDFDQEEKGIISKQNIMNDWINHALTFVSSKNIKLLKVVVDAGNGMAGHAVKECFLKLGVNLVPLYFEHDGTFPNRPPDPTKDENVFELKKLIIRENANFGVAFDPDGDRVAIFDERGNRLSGTVITAILSKMYLDKFPNSTILYNAIVGRAVPQIVEKNGGKAIRVKVGHSLIKPKMRECDAIFAGESSYHFYFKDNYYADSGLIPLLLFIEFVSIDGRKVSEIAEEYDKNIQNDEINFTVDDKQKILDSIKNKFEDADSIDELDGVSVWYTDWWFNIRPSNTENLLRLNIEANTKELLVQKEKELSEFIESLGGIRI